MSAPPHLTQPSPSQPTDLDAFFNTSEFFDLSAMSPVPQGVSSMLGFTPSLGVPSAPYDRLEALTPSQILESGDYLNRISDTNERMGSTLNGTNGEEFLAGGGNDSVSDGPDGADDRQGL